MLMQTFWGANKVHYGRCASNEYYSWFATTKIEFSSQRGEMLLFLAANMAAVTSPADQLYA